MSKYAENALREIRASIEANYGKLSPEALLQELFAHRFAAEQSAGLRAAALKNENASWLAKVAGAAKRLWRSFVAALGGNRIDAKTLSALSPDEAMRRLAEGMARGQTLGRAPKGRGAVDGRGNDARADGCGTRRGAEAVQRGCGALHERGRHEEDRAG